MRILRRDDYRKMPWKNGKGVTEEVASFPDGAGLDEFGWRLSIAHVAEDGPFSVFPGIDRTITLLSGKGMTLDLPDESVELHVAGAPFSFSGDLEISSRNHGGPTVDFNVMTRRGIFSHAVSLLSPGNVEAASLTFVLILEGGLDVGDTQLAPLDVVCLELGETMEFKGEGVLLRIDITPADA
ncbi:environmental stress-induced protein Ves [Rhizobium sp. SG_E_25_P2]|uniref:HutD/Ves family protein n=1 Tax=Rhizobium sp. SG_E_25_P2 TaxID=2879942 RepID=UPI00247318F6|nr:HutD family protein [Rhizobium sp. SG_E_25_P2]MDH6267442.1 environmental stress-induced protein Ves [Rhizobium sp. SG_E_25_P2]